MLPELLLALAIWHHPHDRGRDFASKYNVRRGHVQSWRWEVWNDHFTGVTACRLRTKRMDVRGGVVVFNVQRGIETTHATFRIDTVGPRPVSDVFPVLNKRGVFPERGWINDRAGGEVALPLEMVDGARDIAIRPSPPRSKIRVYDVRYIGEALSALKAAGCPDGGP